MPKGEVRTKTNRVRGFFKKIPYFTVVVAFIAGLGGGILGDRINNESRFTSLDKNSDQQLIVSSQSELISSIAKKVNPSVVSIVVTEKNNGGFNLFFGGGNGTSQSAGTGIIISSDGIIVTNKHVIPEGTTNINVTTNDGKTYEDVTFLARDPRSNYDIAFIKINNVKDLEPAKIGDSSKMKVGDLVVAIGYALGEFENTVTSGIISGLNRPVVASDSGGSTESLTNLFQTDAAINSGNSGGPLLNSNGEVIGINTAVSSNAENIGFSIPINDVKAQISSILTKGKLEVPYLGVRYVVLTEAIKDRYELAVGEGAWLRAGDAAMAVINDSPADKAGLKEGDIIVKVNDEEVTAKNTLSTVLSKYKVGDTVRIDYYRVSTPEKTEATLEIAPSTD